MGNGLRAFRHGFVDAMQAKGDEVSVGMTYQTGNDEEDNWLNELYDQGLNMGTATYLFGESLSVSAQMLMGRAVWGILMRLTP